jgi:hypothetical protein
MYEDDEAIIDHWTMLKEGNSSGTEWPRPSSNVNCTQDYLEDLKISNESPSLTRKYLKNCENGQTASS